MGDRIDIKIGGSATHAAIAAGRGASATAAGVGDTVNMPLNDLAAMRSLLVSLPGLEPKALTRLDEARAELEKPQVDKAEAHGLIAQALTYAKTAEGATGSMTSWPRT